MSGAFDDLRLTDAEREAAAVSLGEHYAVGRLSKQEYDERADVAWKAKRRGDLTPLFADLPGPEKDLAPVSVTTPGARAHRHHHQHNHPHLHGRGHWPFPFIPVIFVLVALTVITHVPFVLFGLLACFVLFGKARGRAHVQRFR